MSGTALADDPQVAHAAWVGAARVPPRSAAAPAEASVDDPFLAGLVRLMTLEAESSADGPRRGVWQALSQAWWLHLSSADDRGTGPSCRPAELAPWQRRRAEQLMLECGGRGGAIAEIARACGLSRGHFSAAFRHSTGQSPHRWLMARRIERACALLAETTLPLTEVASDCGFADQSHMTRSFSKATGVSPAVWRRQRRD